MTLSRREILRLMAAAGLTVAATEAEARARGPGKAPALFVSHGSPMASVDDDAYTQALSRWGRTVPGLRAIVVVSAHWQTRGGLLVTGAEQPETVHDFGGFPAALYELRYPSPGDPALAADVVRRLRAQGFAAEVDPRRGLDHGTWVPLRRTHPEARVPVVQVSLPHPRTPADLLRVGLALAPLRLEGVMVVGSGGAVHNLGQVDFANKLAPPVPWAARFDAWVAQRVEAFDVEGLARWQEEAPEARRAHPTTEHFDPVFVALGAALEGDRAATVYEGFQHGTLSLRSFQLG
jgi:4,5-DOPA dioxygenase extradiol